MKSQVKKQSKHYSVSEPGSKKEITALMQKETREREARWIKIKADRREKAIEAFMANMPEIYDKTIYASYTEQPKPTVYHKIKAFISKALFPKK